MVPKVYSYSRWSTPEQRQGNSYLRQMGAAQEYAAAHGMVVDETLVDDGKSAFRGSNVRGGEQAGALGRFLERIAAGDIMPGSVLVLENLDRMSRMAPRKALLVLSAIVDKGIAVHTTSDHATYTADELDSPTGLQSLLIALLAFNTANQESEKKRSRLQDAWVEKRRNAAQKPMTATGPKWLRLDRKSGKWKPIPDRVKIVRRIFRDAIAGKGVQLIARELNEEGVPVFGHGAHWHRTYITKVLDNPGVIGRLVPHIIAYDSTGKQLRVPQDPIEGYYPTVVDVNVYEQVRSMRQDTPHPLRGKAASREAQNLFGGLLRCARCGGSMYRESKSTKHLASLICAKAKSGAGCKYQLVRYSDIEGPFLNQIGRVLESVPHQSEDASRLQAELERVDANAEALANAAAELREQMGTSYSTTLATEHRRLISAIDAADRERKALGKRLLAAAGPLLTQRLNELSVLLGSDPIDRTRANALLRVLARAISLDLDSGFLHLEWKSGGQSDIPVLAQAFGFQAGPLAHRASGNRSQRGKGKQAKNYMRANG